MYRSFEARNFRGIKRVQLTDLARVNLLTGLNDAGKTSVMEAIFLHASGPLAGGIALSVLRSSRDQGLVVNATTGETTSVWESLFRNLDTSRPISFSGSTDKGQYTLELAAEAGATGISVTPNSSSANRQGSSGTLVVSEKRGNNPTSRYVQSISVSMRTDPTGDSQTISFTSHLEPPASEPYIKGTLVAGPVSPNLAQGYSELRRRRGTVNVLEAMQVVDDRIHGLEVLISEGQPQLHVDLGDGILLPIQLLGDGPVSVAKYLIAMAQSRDGILLIDEIGAGIHHTVYEQVWTTLFRAAERLNVQLFATTHSEEVIRSAQSALAKRSNELRVLRLSREPSDSATRVSVYGDAKLNAAIAMNADLR